LHCDGKPKLQPGGADGDGVTVAKDFVPDGFTVDSDKRIWATLKAETILFLKFQDEVLVPNAIIFELEIISRSPPYAERKIAGH
jgi:hypothetical protein